MENGPTKPAATIKVTVEKLDPNPQAQQTVTEAKVTEPPKPETVPAAPVTAIVAPVVPEPEPKPEPEKKEPVAKKAKKPVAKKPTDEPIRHTDLGCGFEFNHKHCAFWAMMAGALAQEGNFQRVVTMLKSSFHADEVHSKKLMDMMLVSKDKLMSLIHKNPLWKKRAQTKLERVQRRAQQGVKRAIAQLADPKLVKEGIWIGDMEATISNCVWSDRDKFSDIGLAFRQFPARAKQGEEVFFALFPIEFDEQVEKAYKIAFSKSAKTHKEHK